MKITKTLQDLMGYKYQDTGDCNTPFTDDSIGVTEPQDEGLADRLNMAAGYLTGRYGIDIVEARCRLWNGGDFYLMLILIENELNNAK